MALRRVKQVAQVVGGAYCLYQGVKWLMEVTEHKHKELRDHTDDTPRLAPTGFLAERFFQNSQGLWIYKRAWVPVMKPIAVVFIAHGYGEHCGRYEHVAKALNAQGIIVFSMDHQGHGQSEGCRTHVVEFDHYVDDLLQYVRETLQVCTAEVAALPRFLLGHSMGGAIAFLASKKSADLWTGVIFSGPAIEADPSTATPSKRAAAKFLANALPKFTLGSLEADRVCSDPVVVQHYMNDPLVHKGGMGVRWGHCVLTALDQINRELHEFSLPFLVLHGEADKVCDIAGSRNLMDKASSTDKQIITYPDLFHEIFNEPCYERVLRDVTDWIVARVITASSTTEG